ncbi:hypothetical protein Trydic_g5101 [Trypoxylus dichotomus]
MLVIAEIIIQPTDLLVSFNVTSLFIKVPIPDSHNIIEQLLEQDNKSSDLTRLIDKCLISIYFVFQGKFFKQIQESFKSVVLENSHLKSKVWYLDDTFIIWPHERF